MSPDALKYLYDVRVAGNKIRSFTEGKNWSDYTHDDLLKSAVERQFEIIGEALNQLSRRDRSVCQGDYGISASDRIPKYPDPRLCGDRRRGRLAGARQRSATVVE